MKYLFLIVLIISSVNLSEAQNIQIEQLCNTISNTTELYCKNKKKKAAKLLSDYLIKNDNHSTVEEMKFALGLIYFEAKKYNKALDVLNHILTIKNENKIDSNFILRDCTANADPNQCQPPFINRNLVEIKYESSLILAKIFIKKKKFQKAKRNLILADRKYRQNHKCGTGNLEEDLRMALAFSEYYQANNQLDSAIIVLLPNLILCETLPLYHSDKMLKRAIYLLKLKYKGNREKLMGDINNAIKNDIIFDEYMFNKRKERIYYMSFMNEKMQIGYSYLFRADLKDLKIVRDFIRQTNFYEEIIKKE